MGVPALPVTVTEAVTELPNVMGLTGTRVGVLTVGVAALTVWIPMNAESDNKMRNVIIRICSFFMFLHSAVYFLTWSG